MEYIDRHPQGRARLFRQYVLEQLMEAPTIRMATLVAKFNAKHNCNMPMGSAASQGRYMVTDGRLVVVKKGVYAHAKRPEMLTPEEMEVLLLLNNASKPRRIADMAKQLRRTPQSVYLRVRFLKSQGLVRKRKVDDWPVGYSITEKGEALVPKPRTQVAVVRSQPQVAAAQPAVVNPFD